MVPGQGGLTYIVIRRDEGQIELDPPANGQMAASGSLWRLCGLNRLPRTEHGVLRTYIVSPAGERMTGCHGSPSCLPGVRNATSVMPTEGDRVRSRSPSTTVWAPAEGWRILLVLQW